MFKKTFWGDAMDEKTKFDFRSLAAGTAVAVSIASGIAFIVVSAIY
jgi:hypothetical protein